MNGLTTSTDFQFYCLGPTSCCFSLESSHQPIGLREIVTSASPAFVTVISTGSVEEPIITLNSSPHIRLHDGNTSALRCWEYLVRNSTLLEISSSSPHISIGTESARLE